MINYLSASAHVNAGQVVVYRVQLSAGQQLMVHLTPASGDPDLYVWRTDGTSAGFSEKVSGDDEVMFTAAAAGVYQIEVEGATAANYNLAITSMTGLEGSEPDMSLLSPDKGRKTPYIQIGDTPIDDVGLPAPAVTGYNIYLPLTRR
nr:MAG: hypothetical protein EHM70_01965 [Chloroflexota bacterium]